MKIITICKVLYSFFTQYKFIYYSKKKENENVLYQVKNEFIEIINSIKNESIRRKKLKLGEYEKCKDN